ncbi:hypothetical protein Plec18170_009197 [Paecilomyces lecythidis]
MCPSSFQADDPWGCLSNLTKESVDKWIPGGSGANGAMLGSQHSSPVRYCYSQRTSEQCKANIVPIFLIVVVICNTFKLISFALTLWFTKQDPPLCTTGDVIQSFLQQPDPYTKGRCLVEKQDYERHRGKEWTSRPTHTGDLWTGGRWMWAKAIHWWQWAVYLSAAVIAIFMITLYNGSAAAGRSSELESSILPQSVATSYPISTDGVSNILTCFLRANTPQVAISYIYLGLNNILSTILAMAEWCSYTAGSKTPAKGLRVSSPALNTEQMSTYTLSMPLKWWIPVAVSMAALHWTISQTYFFARIEVHDVNTGQVDLDASVTDVFFSRFGEILTISLGFLITLSLVVISSFIRYPDTIPLAGCCSASIAAACQPSHPSKEEDHKEFPEDLAYQRLQWGAVGNSESNSEVEVEHATFGTDVRPLESGKLYA